MSIESLICIDHELYGSGREGDVSMPGCDIGQDGERSAICRASGIWQPQNNTCILSEIKELLDQSQVAQNGITYVTDDIILWKRYRTLLQGCKLGRTRKGIFIAYKPRASAGSVIEVGAALLAAHCSWLSLWEDARMGKMQKINSADS